MYRAFSFFAVCVSLSWTMCQTSPQSAYADVNGEAIAKTGLVVHWEANLGGVGLAHGENSLVLWPHSTIRSEYVTVHVGNRLIQRIDGTEVDQVALEKQILAGNGAAVTPRLGLAGAKKQAEKLVSTYKTLGRTAVLSEFSQPLTYIVSLTKNGIVQAMDAETGAVLWQSEVALSTLPMLGPGVSDKYVTVTNGNTLYIFDLRNGNILKTHKLAKTPSGASIPVGDRVLVPSVNGMLVCYDILNLGLAPIVLTSGVENRLSTVLSADRNFLAWSSKNDMVLVNVESKPQLWAKVNAYEHITARPAAVSDGFVFASANGTVVRTSLDRVGGLVWRTKLATQISSTPVVGTNQVLLTADDGKLISLDLVKGENMWEQEVLNIDAVLGIGANHVYAKDTSGALRVIDATTGNEINRAHIVLPEVISNSISDRLFVVTADGHLSCLREADSLFPKLVLQNQVQTPKANATKPSTSDKPDPAKPESEEDIFNSDMETTTDTATEEEDPFKDPF